MNGSALHTTDLSVRELQVLYWMSHGQSNAAIGLKLGVSEDTVKTHARRLFRKLTVFDRAHAVRKGFERGLLQGGAPLPPPVPPRPAGDPAAVLWESLVALGWTPPPRVMAPERES